MNWIILPVTALSTFTAVSAILPILQRRVIDVPNHRSSHTVPTPRGGGIGLLIGGSLGGLASIWMGAPLPVAIVAPVFCLALLGLADDLLTLSARVRLLAQGMIALVAVLLLVDLNAWTDVVLAMASLVFVVGYTNSFNFMDGINGISGTAAAVTGLWFAYVGVFTESSMLVALGSVLAGMGLGFIPKNLFARAVFLGDVGSYLLGGFTALVAIYAWQEGVPWQIAGAPMVIYIADTAWAVLRRLAQGRPVGEPHRQHVYQRLVDTGLTHGGVSLLVGSAVAMCCLLAYLLGHSAVQQVSTTAVIVGMYLSCPLLLAPESKDVR